MAGDALALPFRDASFDLVSCNLFAHHLSPQELVRFVDEALRVCRVAVLINDLVRHRCTWRWCMPVCLFIAAASRGMTPRFGPPGLHAGRDAERCWRKPGRPEWKFIVTTCSAWE